MEESDVLFAQMSILRQRQLSVGCLSEPAAVRRIVIPQPGQEAVNLDSAIRRNLTIFDSEVRKLHQVHAVTGHFRNDAVVD